MRILVILCCIFTISAHSGFTEPLKFALKLKDNTLAREYQDSLRQNIESAYHMVAGRKGCTICRKRRRRAGHIVVVKVVQRRPDFCSEAILRRSRQLFHLAGISLQVLFFVLAFNNDRVEKTQSVAPVDWYDWLLYQGSALWWMLLNNTTYFIAAVLVAVIAATSYLPPLLCAQKEKPKDSISEALYASAKKIRSGEVWRLVTAALIHGDFLHIARNMLSLFGYGMRSGGFLRAVHRVRIDKKRNSIVDVLFIYSLCAVLGNLAHIIWSSVPAVGASGGIYGLKGYTVMQRYIRSDYSLDAVWHELQMIGMDLLLELMLPGQSGIAHFAHLGGFITGVLMRHCETRWGFDIIDEKQLPLIAWIALVLLLGFGHRYLSCLPEELSSKVGIEMPHEVIDLLKIFMQLKR